MLFGTVVQVSLLRRTYSLHRRHQVYRACALLLDCVRLELLKISKNIPHGTCFTPWTCSFSSGRTGNCVQLVLSPRFSAAWILNCTSSGLRKEFFSLGIPVECGRLFRRALDWIQRCKWLFPRIWPCFCNHSFGLWLAFTLRSWQARSFSCIQFHRRRAVFSVRTRISQDLNEARFCMLKSPFYRKFSRFLDHSAFGGLHNDKANVFEL